MNNVKYDDEDIGKCVILNQNVEADTELKKLIIEYVGNSLNPESGEITVEHVVEVLSKEFPEFLMAIAEENFFRGYHQAMSDVEFGEKVLHELDKEQTEHNISNTSV